MLQGVKELRFGSLGVGAVPFRCLASRWPSCLNLKVLYPVNPNEGREAAIAGPESSVHKASPENEDVYARPGQL